MKALTPVTITTMDGEERRFLLSLGGLKALRDRLKCKSVQDLLGLDAVDGGIPILYEALLDKGALTEEQFANLMPSDLVLIGRTLAKLFGVSLPDENPTPPAPGTVQ